MKRHLALLFSGVLCAFAGGCVAAPSNENHNLRSTASPSPSVSPTPADDKAANAESLTLPVLDAFFADADFSALLRSRLDLPDQQVASLKELARTETAKLNESDTGKSDGESATARASAAEKISAVIGKDKTVRLAELVRERWDGAVDEKGKSDNKADNKALGRVPNDSRVVVNIPAYRMDVFDSGRLVKSYKIGIGYPQFPLPVGLRKANTIIFNPTWTPPDEPWVAKMKKVSAGEKVEAGSPLNPLGPIKIPIGGPSLIHGGKSPAKLGTFASHGCVGLTTPQVKDFAKLLAKLGGAQLTNEELAGFARIKTETKQLKLPKLVPVELRYETIIVEDGKLHVYRDVYDQNTNTEEKLRAVLEANGIKLEDLTEAERTQVLDALVQMSTPDTRRVASTRQTSSPDVPNPHAEKKSGAATKGNAVMKNQKEIVVEIAALKGRGYPAPSELDNGSGKTKAVAK